MKTLTTSLIAGCAALAFSSAFAQDGMKKNESMPKDGMMKSEMTMQQCKDHMAMAKKDGMKKDDAMMKMDTMCADMMKKDDGMMKKDGMSTDPMMKKDEKTDPMKK